MEKQGQSSGEKKPSDSAFLKSIDEIEANLCLNYFDNVEKNVHPTASPVGSEASDCEALLADAMKDISSKDDLTDYEFVDMDIHYDSTTIGAEEQETISDVWEKNDFEEAKPNNSAQAPSTSSALGGLNPELTFNVTFAHSQRSMNQYRSFLTPTQLRTIGSLKPFIPKGQKQNLPIQEVGANNEEVPKDVKKPNAILKFFKM